MIQIIEPVHFGATHVQINSAFIASFSKLYIDEEVVLFAEERHITEVGSKINFGKNIKFNAFKKYSNSKIFYWPQKIIGEWIQILKSIKYAKQHKPTVLIWLCLFPTGNLLVQILSKIYLKNQKQIVILHGELAYLHPQQSKWSEIFLRWNLVKAIKMATSKTCFIVLGPTIKKNVVDLFPQFSDKLITIEHPFLYNSHAKEKKNEGVLKVVLFGALNQQKNINQYVKLASKFDEKIEANLIQFSTLGFLSQKVILQNKSLLSFIHSEKFLNQKEFETELQQYDIAVFLNEEVKYRYTASGALHETIHLQIPFLSLQNDYFEYYHRQYNLGIIVASLDEMEEALNLILKGKEVELNKLRQSIIMFNQQNSFLLQTEKLRTILVSSCFL